MTLGKSTTHLILIRHGETDWNVEGRWQGQADIPLNSRGMQQAKEMAQSLAGLRLDAIFSSDLLRARQTAEQLAQVSGQIVRYDPRLREIDQGLWEGLLLSEIQSGYASILERRRSDPWGASPPGGESVNQVHARVIECIEEIIKNYPNQTVAIVSHGFVLALIIARYLHKPVEKAWELIPQNCEAFEITVSSKEEWK